MARETDWQRRVRQSLEALRLAGIEWLPEARAVVPRADFGPNPPKADEPVPTRKNATSPAHEPVMAVTPEQRRLELVQLAQAVAKCARCPELCSTRTQTVFGVGPIDVDLCCVGEAPGADEDRLGEPFVGAAGQLLTRILAASGFDRSEVYICNILKCRPPGNRTPKDDEASNCREYLDRQLALVRPKYIVAFGGTAAQNLLATKKPMAQLRGQFHKYNGIPVMVTYHPAYLLPHRQPAKKKEVWDDMKTLVRAMGRELPPPPPSSGTTAG